MTGALTWPIARTAGLLGWILLALATIWGLLAAGRLLERRPSPAWLVDLHRHLGDLTLLVTVVHVGAIVADDFVDYRVVEVLVPFASDDDTLAVAVGVVALWLLVAVQATSWLRRLLAPHRWRVVHRLGLALTPLVIVHGLLLGTDTGNALVVVVSAVLVAELVVIGTLRHHVGRRRTGSEGDEGDGGEGEGDADEL